jgi:DNA-binding PadR family transcriptional regulator
LDYGQIRLLVLSMIAEGPSHGYELIRSIAARSGGTYCPSPGVIYPTLIWLEEMGLVAAVDPAGARKSFGISGAGRAFLSANAEEVELLQSRINKMQGRARRHVSPVVLAAMDKLKAALRARLGSNDTVTADEIARIAALIEAAADRVKHG